MKLRNKETGEIVDVESITTITPTLIADKNTIQLTVIGANGYREIYRYKSLAEFNEKWEGAPEASKEAFHATPPLHDEDNTILIEFDTHEEAMRAAEKLKAWKRLRDKGFRFTADTLYRGSCCGEITFDIDDSGASVREDLDLLFGGEE